MIHIIKVVPALFIFTLFSISTYAHNKVVVIPTGNAPSDKLVPGNTERVVNRAGFSAQCTQWNGDVCVKPWIAMNEKSVYEPSPHCIDQPAKLRPIWHGNVDDQAAAFCWIATGDATYVSADFNVTPSTESGWNYANVTGSGPGPITDCSNIVDFRRTSNVAIPDVGLQNWAFENFSESRSGSFSSYECNW